MSVDQAIIAVNWEKFVASYHSPKNSHWMISEIVEDCELDLEFVADTNYFIGMCIAEETRALRKQLSRPQFEYIYQLFCAVFPNYMRTEMASDKLVDWNKWLFIHDCKPRKEDKDRCIAMMNPESVGKVCELIRQIDTEEFRKCAIATWAPSDCFSDAEELGDYLKHLCDYFVATETQSGGIVNWSCV